MSVPEFSENTPKDLWREHVLAERRLLDDAQRAMESSALCHAVGELAAGHSVVAAYVPIGREPGSIEMLDAMAAAGATVLLPSAHEPGPLKWARYEGRDALVRAPYGLLEPSGPLLEPDAVGQCSVVLLPALAVDRRGVRLGRGAGFYDRTLDLCSPEAMLVAIVRDEELFSRLPTEPHDRRVTHALTPGGGLVRLGTE
ncbi:5-formyltetrahydrofolate cyclo-ligase [Rhodococcus fascians]|uniref:5-formyltetrahydrofolate cyclo-ligase n=1 Tax=Rhodococcoides fascians TaxID=1828 RepID=UPI00195F7566|nr:5-formyltetrahydrofolate cyclo-ligase [Rhodococcus fascians]MBM7244112.1 5-formyltetrahydrofolate cyclo-ligase [Rhodococcus fascians]MBY3810531.1 5-formyltetrahydrofolate cyclo-ligase [Rhodococcus fascians]MBY3841846.1 5-formyltetrahydrofolate cyclo-ligase [Rhodococcus fascians]MBY3844297.1 5-formyltetrahydrofolate cyclo-ligase [Rhodococcus fascians]MBY3850243.1 5-formyltetrahydrofolate cyclo-ligase [Rhodococcus fascians]